MLSIYRFGRRKPLLAFFGIVALSCIAAGAIPNTSGLCTFVTTKHVSFLAYHLLSCSHF